MVIFIFVFFRRKALHKDTEIIVFIRGFFFSIKNEFMTSNEYKIKRSRYTMGWLLITKLSLSLILNLICIV